MYGPYANTRRRHARNWLRDRLPEPAYKGLIATKRAIFGPRHVLRGLIAMRRLLIYFHYDALGQIDAPAAWRQIIIQIILHRPRKAC